MITYNNNTTIRIRNTTKKTLENLGRKNETYDDIIWKLINHKSVNSHLRNDKQ